MTKIKLSKIGTPIFVILLAFSISNCGIQLNTNTPPPSNKAKKIPPGQAKKMNGDKSAKKYSPGHNK